MVGSSCPDDGILNVSFSHFLALHPGVIPFPGRLIRHGGVMAAGRSRVTSCRHSHLSTVLAGVSGSCLPGPVCTRCPSLPQGIVFPVQKPRGLKATKGWVTKGDPGDSPRRRGQDSQGRQPPSCCSFCDERSRLSQSSSDIIPSQSTQISDGRSHSRIIISRTGDENIPWYVIPGDP